MSGRLVYKQPFLFGGSILVGIIIKKIKTGYIIKRWEYGNELFVKNENVIEIVK